MRLSLIAALDPNALIGTVGQLPWHLPADLKRFRRLTWGKPVIMGRRTWQSLTVRPLPCRPNIVLTRTWPGRQGPIVGLGCDIVKTVDTAIRAVGDYSNGSASDDEAFVIGGAQVFAATLSLADRLYLTLIDHAFPPGDSPVYFPGGVPSLPDWATVGEETGRVDDHNPWPHRFLILERSFREPMITPPGRRIR